MSSLLKKLPVSIKIHVVKQLWSLFCQLPNCRPNPSAVVVSCEFMYTPPTPTRRDSTVSSRRRRRCVLDFMQCVMFLHLVLMLLMQLFERQTSLLVLTTFVLEPDPDNSWTESSHLDQLFLHQRIGSRVGRVTGPQRVELFLVQYSPDPRCLVFPATMSRRTTTTGAT